MEKYSLVFTTYNDESEIVPFLENISAQTLRPAEIIMADGGSKDDTVKLAEEFKMKNCVNLKIISGKRLNIAEGYNAAIKAASSEYIGVVGVGNQYNEQHFAQLMENSMKTNADISYAPIWGRNTTEFSMWYNDFFLNGEKGIIQKIASNHSALVHKSVFEKIGFFYEGFYYAGEDTEFYYRAMNRGITFSVAENAKVYWDTPKSFGEYRKQTNMYTIGNMQIWGTKDLIKKYWRSLVNWAVIVLILFSSFFTKSVFLTTGFIALFMLCYLLKFRRYWLKGSVLCVAARFMPGYYFVKNIKYLRKKNKVQI